MIKKARDNSRETTMKNKSRKHYPKLEEVLKLKGNNNEKQKQETLPKVRRSIKTGTLRTKLKQACMSPFLIQSQSQNKKWIIWGP